MKRFVCCLIGWLMVQTSLAQLSLTLPMNYAVYQRSSSNNATVWIAGQVPNTTGATANVQWRILRLNPTNGAYVNDVTAGWQSLTTQSYGIFRFSYPLSGGWYQVETKTIVNGTQQNASSRFGVGEVFMIAGQSNAQGITNNFQYFNQYCYNGVVADNHSSDRCLNDYPIYPVMSNIPTFSNNQEAAAIAIAPQGVSPWYYTIMGNKLVNDLGGIPIAYFNAAQAATTIANWEQSSQGLATYYWFNGSRNICSDISTDNAYHVGQPYSILKTTLKYYASIFGTRGILWHQGEDDNRDKGPGVQGTSENDYLYRLSLVINKSRNDFGNSNLGWFVATATYNENRNPTGRPDFPNWGPVQGAQLAMGNSSTHGNGANTDPPNGTPMARFPDKTHFQGGQLQDAGVKWANSIVADLGNVSPIAANTPPTVSISVDGQGNKVLTASGNFQQYYWGPAGGRFIPGQATGPSVIKLAGEFQCYATTTAGNIVVSQVVTLPSGAPRIAADGSVEEDNRNVWFTVAPNPAVDQTTLIFNLPQPTTVQLEIMDESGKVIKTLTNAHHAEGVFKYPVDISQFRDGLYLCRLRAGGMFITKKMVKGGR